MMYSTYKLNKQDDNIQPWHTPFPIWNQSVVPCPVLTVASWPAYNLLKRQIRWSGIPLFWRIFHSLLWSTQSKALVIKAEIDVFLKLPCFFHDPADVGNLISGSSACSKTSLNIWKLTVYISLKPVLENFEHYFTHKFSQMQWLKRTQTYTTVLKVRRLKWVFWGCNQSVDRFLLEYLEKTFLFF